MNKITIIGGGASGLMAAISAAKKGVSVCVIEHNEKVGKKILSTGNGRCNFTNTYQDSVCYRSETSSFPWTVLKKFSATRTETFFQEIGLCSKNKNGGLYPQSGQAESVLDVLRMEALRLDVNFRTNEHCEEINPKKQGFSIRTDKDTFFTHKVILATGSKAAPTTGSDGSGYTLAQTLGHHIVPVLPALVQLKCEEKFYKQLAGIRVDGSVQLHVDGRYISEDRGEIQLTNYGISGIPVFQISRYASIGLYEKKEVTAVLNFMADFTGEDFLIFLKNRIKSRPCKTGDELFIGLFHKKLSDVFFKRAEIKTSLQVGTLTEQSVKRLAHSIQHFSTKVIETNPFAQSQVCRGGVDTREVLETMESRLVSGLYFAGEIVDVDGLCGGYNLQWAWSSGYIAGEEAAHA